MSDLLKVFNELTLESDKETVHSYVSNLYSKVFDKFKKKNPTVVEIGVLHGGSIEMAYKYFGPDATIIGLDIQMVHNVQDWAKDKPSVRLISSDAYNSGVASLVPEYDIFIDDGPHSVETQKKAIDLYLPKVKSGGLFVIEDIQSDEDLRDLLIHIPEDMRLYTKVYDLRSVKGRYDDIIIAVDKP